MPTARLAVCGALAYALAAPAAAHAAPTLQPLQPCYVSAGPTQREPVLLSASGFTPNAQVDVTIDGAPVADAGRVQTDPSGAFEGSVPAPYRRRGEAPFTVTLTETGNPANSVSVDSRVTALTVDVRPRQAAPTRRVRFSGRGFTDPSSPVYAHYVFGGRVRETVAMGRPRGACGTFSARRRQIPVRPRTGTWLVQFDQLARYTDPPQAIFVQLQIRVFRSFPQG
ncbi:MAG TPA: hypothetical protein VN213_21515 [Solirubrobacteraceae bacterium]|nr:hypothetical protein [Solirubrobacteraceae bacterium]